MKSGQNKCECFNMQPVVLLEALLAIPNVLDRRPPQQTL